MTRALLHHTTRVAVMIEDDTGNIAEWVNALTILLGALLVFAAWVKPAVVFSADVVEAATFTGKVLAICFSALAFGLGVRL